MALTCNFCGKCQHEVKNLMAGPDACICNECVILCVESFCKTEEKQKPLTNKDQGVMRGG